MRRALGLLKRRPHEASPEDEDEDEEEEEQEGQEDHTDPAYLLHHREATCEDYT
jgi:hypothetical protein